MTLDYKIYNNNYDTNYDLSLMDQYISYTLNSTFPYQYKYNNDISAVNVARVHSFLEFILFKNIEHLYYFMNSLKPDKILYLIKYLKLNINTHTSKHNYIKYIIYILYQKISVIDFIALFDKSFYIYCDHYITINYNTYT